MRASVIFCLVFVFAVAVADVVADPLPAAENIRAATQVSML
jgi:hypothetical protein